MLRFEGARDCRVMRLARRRWLRLIQNKEKRHGTLDGKSR